MNDKETPCIECERRAVGCHTRCKDYQEWKKRHDENRQKQIAERRARCEFADYKKNTYGKMTRRGYEKYRQDRQKGIRRDV